MQGDIGMLRGDLGCQTALYSPLHSLSWLIQQPTGRALAAQEDVFLQCQLVEHPVCHAQRWITWKGNPEEKHQRRC